MKEIVNIKNILVLSAIFITIGLKAQIPYYEVIKQIKPIIVSIEAVDDSIFTDKYGNINHFSMSGSGVIFSNDTINAFVLTNEHVVALKDSNFKTIRFAKNIMVRLNLENSGILRFKAEVEKSSEKNDIVALKFDDKNKIVKDIPVITPSLCYDKKQLQEGYEVIYCGFPYLIGRIEAESPLSRTGIISQLPKTIEGFYIDAFVQPGYSGSPVFLVKRNYQKNGEWGFRFIGLCHSYPNTFGNVFLNGKDISNVKFQENPGFTYVIPMSDINELFEKK